MPSAPVTIITGAGTGIGRAAAIRLARSGHRLVLAGRRRPMLEESERIAREAGAPDVLVQPADLADPSNARVLIDATLQQFGRIDALVNNAGYVENIPIAETDEALLHRTLAVNTVGPSLLISRSWPAFVAQGGGRIVNVTSYATIDPFPGLYAYAQAKGAAMLQVKAVHNEGQDHGIRAFAVAPGAVETPMLRGLFDENVVPRAMTLDPDTVAQVIAACVLGERDSESGETIPLPSPGPSSESAAETEP